MTFWSHVKRMPQRPGECRDVEVEPTSEPRGPQPGPMTLEGTNTYVVGRDPAVVIDPGPDDAGHIEAIRAAASERGGIGTVLLTHGHADHLAASRRSGIEPTRPADGEMVAGLTAIATPGHAADHLCFLLPTARRSGRSACFTRGPDPGRGLDDRRPPRDWAGRSATTWSSLRRLQGLDLEVLYPGHGPEVDDPQAKIAEYIAHRQQREDRLVAALDRGERSTPRCSPRSGTTCPSSFGAPPPLRCRPTSRSSRTRAGFRRTCVTDLQGRAPGMKGPMGMDLGRLLRTGAKGMGIGTALFGGTAVGTLVAALPPAPTPYHGRSECPGPGGPDRDRPRPLGNADRAGADGGRPLVRPGLLPRPGPALAVRGQPACQRPAGSPRSPAATGCRSTG